MTGISSVCLKKAGLGSNNEIYNNVCIMPRTSVSYQGYNINRNSDHEFVISPAYTVGGTTYSNFTTAGDLANALKNINW